MQTQCSIRLDNGPNSNVMFSSNVQNVHESIQNQHENLREPTKVSRMPHCRWQQPLLVLECRRATAPQPCWVPKSIFRTRSELPRIT